MIGKSAPPSKRKGAGDGYADRLLDIDSFVHIPSGSSADPLLCLSCLFQHDLCRQAILVFGSPRVDFFVYIFFKRHVCGLCTF